MSKKIGKIKGFLGSFRTRVMLTLVFSLFLVVGLSDLFIYRFSLKMQFGQLRETLESIAKTS
ncbi:MAG: hypothetical protein NT033_02090, partial [Candidatus Omnitrophica bacterium]|nr:hypothetical protein [Candidatus Omnitrophota bacterium]